MSKEIHDISNLIQVRCSKTLNGDGIFTTDFEGIYEDASGKKSHWMCKGTFHSLSEEEASEIEHRVSMVLYDIAIEKRQKESYEEKVKKAMGALNIGRYNAEKVVSYTNTLIDEDNF